MKTVLAALLGGFLLLSSCQEVIDLNLESGQPVLAIDAVLNDVDSPACRVKLMYSAEYLSPIDVLPVTNALVTLRNDLGEVDTLQHSPDSLGMYLSTRMRGQIGRTYTLTVQVEGKTYTATSKMSRTFNLAGSSINYRNDPGIEPAHYVTVFGTDPPGEGDFYLVQFYRNDTLLNGLEYLWPLDDRFTDGQTIVFEFLFSPFYTSGDTVVVEGNSIDRLTWEYFNIYFALVGGNGGPFSSPAWNPESNITGGAVGLFRASSVVRDTLVVP